MIVYVCVSVCVWGRLYPGSGTRSGPTTFNLYDLGNLLNPPDPQFFVPEPLSSIISFFSTSVRWGLNKLVGARGPRWCLLQSEGVVKCTLILSPSASVPRAVGVPVLYCRPLPPPPLFLPQEGIPTYACFGLPKTLYSPSLGVMNGAVPTFPPAGAQEVG